MEYGQVLLLMCFLLLLMCSLTNVSYYERWSMGRFKGHSRAVKVEWFREAHWARLNHGDVFVVLQVDMLHRMCSLTNVFSY